MKNLLLTPDFFRVYAMPKAGGYFTTLFLGLGSGMGFIQELLGHGSSKTTEIYVPITKKRI
jgi:integrase